MSEPRAVATGSNDGKSEAMLKNPMTERAIAAKRADYFAAGTLCVWDVDLLSSDVIKAYHANDPENPLIFRRGEMAHAGEAVPAGQCRMTISFATTNNNWRKLFPRECCNA